jgi:hypothetical protein
MQRYAVLHGFGEAISTTDCGLFGAVTYMRDRRGIRDLKFSAGTPSTLRALTINMNRCSE